MNSFLWFSYISLFIHFAPSFRAGSLTESFRCSVDSSTDSPQERPASDEKEARWVRSSHRSISPALQPNSKRTICDWQRLGPAAWISDRVLPTWFPESINRPHIRAGVLKISRGTDNVKSGCTHRQSTRKRTCANLLTIVPTVIAAQ